MSLEVMKSISDAEDAAREARLSAQARAKSMIAEAEKKGQAAVEATVLRAEEEVGNILENANAKASGYALQLNNETSDRQAALRSKAESRLDKAASLIVERIVKT